MRTLIKEVRSHYSEEKDINVQSTLELLYLKAVINDTLKEGITFKIHHPVPIH